MTTPAIPPGVLADFRLALRGLMLDTCTNSRTSASTPVCISTDTGRVRLPDSIPFLPLPRWLLEQPDGTDTKPADQLVVAGKGTYTVLEALVPVTVNIATESICVLWLYSDGSLAFPTNQTVTFSDLKDNAKTTVPTKVLIQWITDEQRASGVEGTWRVYWQESLRYPDHTEVGYNAQINWTRTPNPLPTGSATLSKPVHPYPGILPIVMATFVEER